MRELSLHILDIIENSRRAEADLIKIKIEEKIETNLLKIVIKDNGNGISQKKLNEITDPFITSRTTREVGLGLSLFKAAAESCGGRFEIDSQIDKGTRVTAEFEYDHIDRAPLGDMTTTLSNFIAANGDQVDIIYQHQYQENSFKFDSREIKAELEDLSIQSRQIISWIREYIGENLAEIRGGEAF
ncbi:histidine kinase/DNA gyrase B/HSP90-like ATPase [Halanaerobium saccharolyticum]|uniref:histidine kinase n=1 Tax=Halanaerobium saccharolyticum TaxID=43595 RepID=A0A4R6LNQ0_9FIRM|nr:ATP-binding protein [Halanaerobium saccharolyticum]TDO86116.1 histidine kinase/DNA gyrase B/HSP90-like ATPase [Halanaerobium saccharolyticum]